MTQVLRRPSSPTQPALRVTVVICTYSMERWADLTAAVESAWDQSTSPEQVVVVVDHCPELLARARRAFARCTVVPSHGEPGLAGARNSGLEAAHGDVVVFLDDDARATHDWLAGLVSLYSDGRVEGVGGQVTPQWQSERPAWLPPEFDWVVGCSYRGLPTATGPVRNFIGANMSFRREALQRCGGFSEQLGRVGADTAGCEETELCIRVTASSEDGGRLVYQPAAEVLHRVPDTRTTWRYFVRRCMGEGRSKRLVAGLVGSDRALTTERRYVTRTIPRAALRSVADVARGKPAGALRLLALVIGVFSTALGYLTAPASVRRAQAGEVQRDRRTVIAREALLALAGFGTLAVVLELWATVLLRGVAVGHMTGLGLLSVLPARFWLALVILTASFVGWSRRGRSSRLLLAAHVLVLIAILHATPTLLYGTLRYSWAWKHVGIVGYVLDHGGVDIHLQSLSAYQDWPGFFSMNAMLVALAGLHSALSIAPWGPPVNELLYFGPVWLIARRFLADRRLAWTAVWIFYLGNWVGQDYFSPQGFAFFLYLVAVVCCLRWWSPGRRPAVVGRTVRFGRRLLQARALVPVGSLVGRPLGWFVPAVPDGWLQAQQPRWVPDQPVMWSGPVPDIEAAPRSVRVWRYLFIVLVAAVIAASHQLTPFMFLSASVLLVLGGVLRRRSLPFVTALLTVGWIVLAARTFLAQNLSWVVKSIGQPLENTGSTLVNLNRVSQDQVLVADVDRLLTAGVVLLAAYGALRVWRSGQLRRVVPALLLVVAPVVALAANNYGGEMLFRVYLFGLPFFAVLGALALAPRRPGRGLVASLATLCVLGLMLGGFGFAYYGKEQMNYFSPDEVQAMQNLYALAPAGSLIIGPTSNLPWAFEHYAAYKYDWFAFDYPAQVRAIVSRPVETLALEMEQYPRAYLVFSRSQVAELEATGVMTTAAFASIENAVSGSALFRTVLHTNDVDVVTLAVEGPPAPSSFSASNGAGS